LKLGAWTAGRAGRRVHEEEHCRDSESTRKRSRDDVTGSR
jgi:hypothetical protein